jgi:nitric oxide reductase subunit B
MSEPVTDEAKPPKAERDGVPRGLKIGALVSFFVALGVLLIGGRFNPSRVPPYPQEITTGTEVVTDKAAILRGQQVYQRYGLMDHGSIWGHGSLRGMDFCAETLHRVGEQIRSQVAAERFGRPYDTLDRIERAVVDAVVLDDIKTNTYDPATGELRISPEKAQAFRFMQTYWDRFFELGDPFHGFLPHCIKTQQERLDLASFFFWTAWAAGTNRPGLGYTYTNNWPADRSVGNQAPDQAIAWSFAGIFALLVVLGMVIYTVHRYRFFYAETHLVEFAERIAAAPVTVSQRKSAKFFLVVILLFLTQIMFGGLLAHYTVHPGSFYFKAVSKWISFSWAKTWHLQLGILWIATAWVGSALYLGPLIGGREPRKQGLLADVLFVAVLLVAVGSLSGEVLSIKGMLGKSWFWVGHQGWEYLELGRLWQILLFVGLLAWLFIAYRALAPRLARDKSWSGLTWFYTYAAIAVVLFYSFGLFYNQHTHLSIADYWRWFVVHIWVEGIFEFFAAASGALLLTALGLVSRGSALKAAYLTAILAFGSGIIGTAHHYFWFGAPGFWMALGAVFSSLEPVPLILLASRAWMEYKTVADAGTSFPYRWPLMFLTASAFWNFLGAGVFGFMINLPIINYYEHATYLTANHAHTALFGTYGMLSVALALFVWRGLVQPGRWNDRLLRVSFWGLNIGLAAMSFLTLLPVGVLEMAEAYKNGLWLAKSSEFFSRPFVQFVGQIRIVPDLLIILGGAVPLALFLFTSLRDLKKPEVAEGESIFGEDQPDLPL